MGRNYPRRGHAGRTVFGPFQMGAAAEGTESRWRAEARARKAEWAERPARPRRPRPARSRRPRPARSGRQEAGEVEPPRTVIHATDGFPPQHMPPHSLVRSVASSSGSEFERRGTGRETEGMFGALNVFTPRAYSRGEPRIRRRIKCWRGRSPKRQVILVTRPFSVAGGAPLAPAVGRWGIDTWRVPGVPRRKNNSRPLGAAAGRCINSGRRGGQLVISATTQIRFMASNYSAAGSNGEGAGQGGWIPPLAEPSLLGFTAADIQTLVTEVTRLQQVEATAVGQLAIAASDLELQRQLNARLEQQVALLEDQVEILSFHLRLLRRNR